MKIPLNFEFYGWSAFSILIFIIGFDLLERTNSLLDSFIIAFIVSIVSIHCTNYAVQSLGIKPREDKK